MVSLISLSLSLFLSIPLLAADPLCRTYARLNFLRRIVIIAQTLQRSWNGSTRTIVKGSAVRGFIACFVLGIHPSARNRLCDDVSSQLRLCVCLFSLMGLLESRPDPLAVTSLVTYQLPFSAETVNTVTEEQRLAKEASRRAAAQRLRNMQQQKRVAKLAEKSASLKGIVPFCFAALRFVCHVLGSDVRVIDHKAWLLHELRLCRFGATQASAGGSCHYRQDVSKTDSRRWL